MSSFGSWKAGVGSWEVTGYRVHRGGVASGLRRDAASPWRQVEKCAAGVPTGGGTVSTRSPGSSGHTHDSRPAPGRPKPEPPLAGTRRTRIFPGVGRGAVDLMRAPALSVDP